MSVCAFLYTLNIGNSSVERVLIKPTNVESDYNVSSFAKFFSRKFMANISDQCFNETGRILQAKAFKTSGTASPHSLNARAYCGYSWVSREQKFSPYGSIIISGHLHIAKSGISTTPEGAGERSSHRSACSLRINLPFAQSV
jgi:hypothetical protein